MDPSFSFEANGKRTSNYIRFSHPKSRSRAQVSAVLGLNINNIMTDLWTGPASLQSWNCPMWGSITPINTSCSCKQFVVLQIFYRNFIAVTISWFDFLHLLQSFIYLKLSKWMSRDIYLIERKAWSPELCPICAVISWGDAHWATAVDTSWSEAWRITWHCWYCALWVHLAVNSNITKYLKKIGTKTNRKVFELVWGLAGTK